MSSVIVFYSDNCPSCKAQKPALERAIRDNPQIEVSYSDVESDNWLLAQSYGVFGIPALVWLNEDGSFRSKHIGPLSSAKLKKMWSDEANRLG